MPKRSTGKKTTKTASRAAVSGDQAKSYTHPESDAALRPDVGIQKQFKGKGSGCRAEIAPSRLSWK